MDRRSRAFEWNAKENEIMHWEPLAKELVYGDSVVVHDHQSARFTASGRSWWFRESGTYTIGYDGRSEDEILCAKMKGEDMGDFPMLVCTGLVFFDKREHSLEIELTDFIKVSGIAGVKPRMRVAIKLEDEEALLDAIFADTDAMRLIADGMIKYAHRQLGETMKEADLFYEDSPVIRIKEFFGDELLYGQLQKDFGEKMKAEMLHGIRITQVEITDWQLHIGFCDVCGEPVKPMDRRCGKGHILHRCPECGELISEGRCKVNGHAVMLCSECGSYVVPYKNHCPVHVNIVF